MSDLLVMVWIAGKRCAFRAVEVSSVIEGGAIAPAPRAPDYVVGITALRSQAMTVIDCRTAIGENAGDFASDDHLVVIQVDGHSYALQVDRVDDVATAQSDLTPIPGGSGTHWARISHGMIETNQGPAMLLDPAQAIVGPWKSPKVAA